MPVTIAGSGQIIKQVIQAVKTDTTVQGGSTFAAIPGLSATITPTNSANKILVMITVYLGSSGGDTDSGFALYKNGSIISGAVGDAATSRIQATMSAAGRNQYEQSCHQTVYLDSPATTSATTYAVYGRIAVGNLYINREVTDSNDASSYRVISTITLMEVAYA